MVCKTRSENNIILKCLSSHVNVYCTQVLNLREWAQGRGAPAPFGLCKEQAELNSAIIFGQNTE